MKKLTTGKMWCFAVGQLGWSLLSALITNWLVYFYQPDEAGIAAGQTLFIPQGLAVLGIAPAATSALAKSAVSRRSGASSMPSPTRGLRICPTEAPIPKDAAYPLCRKSRCRSRLSRCWYSARR